MTKNTEEVTDAPLRVTVRMLVDLTNETGLIAKAGQVTELDADIATDLIDNGLADNNADAIAYALSV